MTGKAKEKIKRVRDSIYFDNPDIIPVQDLFLWDDFIENWKKYFNLKCFKLKSNGAFLS